MSSSILKMLQLMLKDLTCKNFPWILKFPWLVASEREMNENPTNNQKKQLIVGVLIQRWENFPCASTFSCCVVDFISSHLRSVVEGNKTRQQARDFSFFSPPARRNFVLCSVVFALAALDTGDCFVVVLFLRIFTVVLLCFPFLRLRSDTTKKSELKKSSSRFFPQL